MGEGTSIDITPANLQAMFNAYNILFQGAVSSAKPRTAEFCSQIPSKASRNVFAWMAQIPRMREWVGDRTINNIGAFSYELLNKTYEATVGVDRDKIEDDEYGILNFAVPELGRVARLLMDDLTISAIQNGTSSSLALTYDGVAFFSGSHPIDPQGDTTTQSNNITSNALTANNYNTSRAAMMALKGQDGKVLDIIPDLLVVPPALERTALTIVNADFIPGDTQTNGTGASVQNVLKGSARVLVLPQLAGADTTWYLMDTSRAIKPFIQQSRRPSAFTMLTNPQDFCVFMQKTFLMGVDARAAAGYGLWYLAQRNIA